MRVVRFALRWPYTFLLTLLVLFLGVTAVGAAETDQASEMLPRQAVAPIAARPIFDACRKARPHRMRSARKMALVGDAGFTST